MAITVATIVKNERNWYLEKAVEVWCSFADHIVCIDDDSIDDSGALVGETAAKHGKSASVVREKVGLFGNSSGGRQKLWELAVQESKIGDYVFILDADLIPAKDPTPFFTSDVIMFRYFDLWGPNVYRDDVFWTAHVRPRPWAAQIKHRGPWEFPEIKAHSGHLPENHGGVTFDTVGVDYSLLHYGYAEERGRQRQFDKYDGNKKVLSPQQQSHVKTILQPSPRLAELPFEPDYRLI